MKNFLDTGCKPSKKFSTFSLFSTFLQLFASFLHLFATFFTTFCNFFMNVIFLFQQFEQVFFTNVRTITKYQLTTILKLVLTSLILFFPSISSKCSFCQLPSIGSFGVGRPSFFSLSQQPFFLVPFLIYRQMIKFFLL